MRRLNRYPSSSLLLALIPIAVLILAAYTISPASSVSARQASGLTNMSCPNPLLVKLIPRGKRWYVRVNKREYKLSKAGDALRPIMEGRESKAVYLLTPEGVRYTVLQQFTDYARGAGVTCVNWGRTYRR